jgi:hypothetical protein
MASAARAISCVALSTGLHLPSLNFLICKMGPYYFPLHRAMERSK